MLECWTSANGLEGGAYRKDRSYSNHIFVIKQLSKNIKGKKKVAFLVFMNVNKMPRAFKICPEFP